MLEVKEVEVKGHKFQLTPLDPFKAKKCDTKIMKVLAPLLAGLMGGSKKGTTPEGAEPAEAEIDGAMLGQCLAAAIGELEESDTLFRDLFSTTVWLPDDVQAAGCAQLLLDSQNAITKAFTKIGEGPSMFYELAFEIARYNKFTPFAVLGGGEPTPGTSGSGMLARMKGLGLGRLGG